MMMVVVIGNRSLRISSLPLSLCACPIQLTISEARRLAKADRPKKQLPEWIGIRSHTWDVALADRVLDEKYKASAHTPASCPPPPKALGPS
jgi:hypothetical protein